MEIVAQTELVSINATMIVQVLSFLIFMFLIRRVMLRPLRDTMESRSADLKRLQKEIKAQESRLAELTSKMQQETAAVRTAAFVESEKLEAAGKLEAGGILDQARAQIEAQQRQASEDIHQRIATVQQELAKDTESLAATIIAKVLERRTQP
jgi:F-type H+-transporting ATPase subunit b